MTCSSSPWSSRNTSSDCSAAAPRRSVDLLDGPHQLGPVGDGGDDLVAGRGADGAERLVVGRFGERDDELVALEVDGEGVMLARHIGGHQRGRVLMERRVLEVDEADAEAQGERGGEVLGADETVAQERGRQRVAGGLAGLEGALEVVARQDVPIDERLTEPSGLTCEHCAVGLPGGPASPARIGPSRPLL